MLFSLLVAVSGWPALVLFLALLGLAASLISLGCGPAPPPKWKSLRESPPANPGGVRPSEP